MLGPRVLDGRSVQPQVQMETAALKKASETRNKVFVRKVTAVYTPATLEAGTAADVGAAAAADAPEDDTCYTDAGASSTGCLMCICEDSATTGRGMAEATVSSSCISVQ